jgi:hypothetical protein
MPLGVPPSLTQCYHKSCSPTHSDHKSCSPTHSDHKSCSPTHSDHKSCCNTIKMRGDADGPVAGTPRRVKVGGGGAEAIRDGYLNVPVTGQYGGSARCAFSTEIYTRGCHRIPRMFASSDQCHSSPVFTPLTVCTVNSVETLKAAAGLVYAIPLAGAVPAFRQRCVCVCAPSDSAVCVCARLQTTLCVRVPAFRQRCVCVCPPSGSAVCVCARARMCVQSSVCVCARIRVDPHACSLRG